MGWTAPKIDWLAAGAVSNTQLNNIGNNLQYLKDGDDIAIKSSELVGAITPVLHVEHVADHTPPTNVNTLLTVIPTTRPVYYMSGVISLNDVAYEVLNTVDCEIVDDGGFWRLNLASVVAITVASKSYIIAIIGA